MASSNEAMRSGDVTKEESKAGILPSHGITIDVPGITETGRLPMVHHM
jgi:[calcium/calmodulin-dependent protein kinase] kinase